MTKSRLISDRVCARTTRAAAVQPNAAMTPTMTSTRGTEAGTSTVSAIMKISPGKASTTSVKRLSSPSTHPPE